MFRRNKYLIGVIIAVVLVSFVIIVGAVLSTWEEGRLWSAKQEPSPAPAISIAGPEKKVAPPVEKKPAAKKTAKKKPPVPLTATASETREWKQWGVAPYAASREEACKKAPEAIDGFSFPASVKEHFKKLLGATCKGGTEAWLTPGMPLEEMLSGPDAHHEQSYVMRKRTVAELPVMQSPDGRPYPKGAVAETAKALAWRVEHEGRAYMLYLPLVCWNWSWKFGVPPLSPPPVAPPPLQRPVSPPVEECATVEYVVQPGDEVRFAVLAQRRLPTSACWRLCDGADCAAPPSPCDICDWIGPKSVLPEGFEPLHTGKYIARFAKQSLRFPLEVRANFVALCVEREGLGESNSWIVQPTAWQKSSMKVVVPYGGATWPVWGEETIWPGWEQYPPTN